MADEVKTGTDTAATGAVADDAAQEQGGATTPEENGGQERMYSEAEVQALLQKEGDRRVTQALARQRKEFDKKLSLATLDESKRADAEKDITIRELSEQIDTYKREKRQADLKVALQSRGLPAMLADYINISADDGEDGVLATQYVDAIAGAWNTAVQDEVKRRLVSGGVPRSGLAAATDELTADQFKRMTLRQQAELYAKNPNLYKKLTN